MRSLKRRVLAKTLTYKLATFLSSVAIVSLATGSIQLATGVATALVVFNTVIYIGHEAAWNRVSWGREDAV